MKRSISKNEKKSAKNKYCVMSGKLTLNHEVVITKYAIDYVRKLGYYVTPFKVK